MLLIKKQSCPKPDWAAIVIGSKYCVCACEYYKGEENDKIKCSYE
jgi:hypothetical protein